MASGNDPVRFGDFDADFHAGELRRSGVRVHIQEQPLRVLQMLLEHPGELITRDDLQRTLWPNGQFGDFDHGINVAIKKLRDALGDNAETPVFVETMARRGYRFIGKVQTEEVEQSAESTTHIQAARPQQRFLLRIAAIAGFVVITGVAALLLLPLQSKTKVLTDRDTVVVADFVNKTGDPVFDSTLKQGLKIGLEESPFLQLVSDQRVRETLSLMKRPPDEPLTGTVAREVCQRRNSTAVVTSEIAALGVRYIITLQALACAGEDSLARVQVEAASKENVPTALADACGRLRHSLGESLASVQKLNTPLLEATTSSFEALQQFSLAFQMFNRGRFREAVPFYERAIELDPNFARAYLSLGVTYGVMGESERGRPYVEKAFTFRDRVSQLERFRILGIYYMGVTREVSKAIDTYEACHQLYPRDRMCANNLGIMYRDIGDYVRAAEHLQRSRSIEPTSVNTGNLALTYLALNRLDEARAILEEQIARGADLHRLLYVLAVLQNNATTAQREARLARAGGGVLWEEADVAAYSGKLRHAAELRRRDLGLQRRTQPEAAAAQMARAALGKTYVGGCAQALEHIKQALALRGEGEIVRTASYWYAQCGDMARAKSMLEEEVRRFPLDTVLNQLDVPTVFAAIEIHRGNPEQAIEFLRIAEPLEKTDAVPFRAIYTRGLAYLKVNSGREAATEFEKVIANRNIEPFNILVALSHLQLGRAYSLAGDKEKALAAYEHFLVLWRDADPDIPILKEAKIEYAKLR